MPLRGLPPCSAERSRQGAQGAQGAGTLAAVAPLLRDAGEGKRTRPRGRAGGRWK